MPSLLSARAAVLLALRRGPACGLDLAARLSGLSGGSVRPAGGSVYPLLARLQAEGLLRKLPPRPGRTRGRGRVDYELTFAGIAASDGLREALRPMVSEGTAAPDGPLDERMQVRIRTARALSRFAVRLRRRTLQAGRRA